MSTPSFFGFVVLDDQDLGSKIKGAELLLRYSLDARLQTTLGFRVLDTHLIEAADHFWALKLARPLLSRSLKCTHTALDLTPLIDLNIDLQRLGF